MNRWAFGVVLVLLAGTASEQTFTPKKIFEQNKGAIVRIFVNGTISGCGFIVSGDGLIVTANHVIASAKPTQEQPFPIAVEMLGQSKSHFATVADHSVSADVAVLRITGSGFPHVTLGDSTTVQVYDPTTLVTFWPAGNAPLLLTGIVSGIGAVGGTNAIVFQIPVRKGFSGSPIFDSHGKVVGIVTTRLVGIAPNLDTIREQMETLIQQKQIVIIQGANYAETIAGLIDSLDSDLVSGLGSAVSIDYATAMVNKQESSKQK
jgi:S1-C subfamily serine protease